MKKSFIFLLLSLVSCKSTYTTAGKVPSDHKDPTLVENYKYMGAFFAKGEQRSYSQFAKEKCSENGYKTFEGYAVSDWTSSGWMILGWLPITDAEKTAKIWCIK